MSGPRCSWVHMQKIRQKIAASEYAADFAALLDCSKRETFDDWKAVISIMDVMDSNCSAAYAAAEHFRPSHAREIARAFRKAVGGSEEWTEETKQAIADWTDRCETEQLTVQQLRPLLAREVVAPNKPALPTPISSSLDDLWSVDQADCLDWFAARPPDSLDLVFGSPPYEDARLYLEGGADQGIARGVAEWVAWMTDVYAAALRCCKGLVAFVVAGRTEGSSWSASPALLMSALVARGITLRNPPIYKRVGIPGSGGPDWLRGDYEFVVCATRGGKLPWSDNTAMGHAPKYGPGGEPSHRLKNGDRVNDPVAYASPEDRANEGSHRSRRRAGRVYHPPERSNPGNVIDCGAVGGGNMGNRLCHENEAPFPEYLAEFFVRSFCPPGGVVCDPFSGSGTTGAMAVRSGRRFAGCDLRASQVELSRRRLSAAQPPLPLEV